MVRLAKCCVAFVFVLLVLAAGCDQKKDLSTQPLVGMEPNETVSQEPIVKPTAPQPNGTVVNSEPSVKQEQPQPPVDTDEPTLKLKGIGINLDYYDPATGMAGDLKFTNGKFMFGILFSDYGFFIPANSGGSPDKFNPQPTFTAPMGTKVHSLVDGVVVKVPVLYSGDYSIHVAASPQSRWIYETEHVINPLVKVGDHVTAGQVIAEVSPHNKDANNGFGIVEIGILKGGNPPQHVCPFAYLDESIRDDVQKKLTALYSIWEDYRDDPTLYDESALKMPGCLTLEPIEG